MKVAVVPEGLLWSGQALWMVSAGAHQRTTWIALQVPPPLVASLHVSVWASLALEPRPMWTRVVVTAASAITVALTDGSVVIEYTGTLLKSATSVTGPYSDVAGASSPYSVAPTKAAEFYIAE